MRQALLEGIAQAFDHAHRQLRGLQRLDLGANLDEVAEVPALDELHDQVVRPAVGGDVVDGHDVGMPQREPQLAFADELGGLLRLVGLSGSLNFRKTFSATISPVWRCTARNTRAKVPAPTA